MFVFEDYVIKKLLSFGQRNIIFSLIMKVQHEKWALTVSFSKKMVITIFF